MPNGMYVCKEKRKRSKEEQKREREGEGERGKQQTRYVSEVRILIYSSGAGESSEGGRRRGRKL